LFLLSFFRRRANRPIVLATSDSEPKLANDQYPYPQRKTRGPSLAPQCPDAAARAYLEVIARNPSAVAEALRAKTPG
jgi:hypothetical protein